MTALDPAPLDREKWHDASAAWARSGGWTTGSTTPVAEVHNDSTTFTPLPGAPETSCFCLKAPGMSACFSDASKRANEWKGLPRPEL
ncbi:MAG: hypothetical protein ABI781_12025, partial [Burkholderiales bacterium]